MTKLVASTRKTDAEIFIPRVDFHYDSKDKEGNDKKVVCSVGFFEIEKRKVVFDSGKKQKFGDVIKKHFVPTEDENRFREEEYLGKTLMLSVQTDEFTDARREATEIDKEKYKPAFDLFMKHKKKEEAEKEELAALKKQVAELEKEKSKKSEKSKE